MWPEAMRVRAQGWVESMIAHRRTTRVLVAAAVPAIVIAVLARWGPDWPAQEFRALVAQAHPLALWANNWFGGQPLAGYSLVFPLLAGVIGVPATGVLAVVAAAWGATRLLPEGSRRADLVAEAAVVISLASSLLQGQLPYLLGTAFGVLALVAARSSRPVLAALAAALCGLSSPLAGFFLIIAVVALSAVTPWRRLLPFSAAGLGFLVPLLFGGAGGAEPYPVSSLAVVVVFAAAVGVCFRGDSATCRVLRRLGLGYVLAALVLFPFPEPVGGNMTRLGLQLALPTLALALRQRALRRRVLAGVAVLAVSWAAAPMATSVAHGAGDPSQQRAYFTPLLRFLHRARAGDPRRVEIPMTREHWESRWVAASVPLARGWERQTDVQQNPVLYRPLTAERYRRWLDANAVGWVALPDVPLDAGGLAESVLLRHPPAWLRPVWHDRHWQVWRVAHPTPMATAPATLLHLGESEVVLRYRAPGTSTVRVRASSLWRVARGTACIVPSPGRWLQVTAGPGRVVLVPGLPGGGDTDRCR